ncbi:unnamed protein product [Gongylonema pulchrum]|uniref:Uncharacterized protein n=1 Tax=Gongylonema pulchrum TaxID=637853 RepID=A0A3P6Q8W8_9BILA|nr:unnamed protein product [Gongylonema pulchrum]
MENDVHTELIPLRLLIDFFNTAYKCQLKLALQATLFARILERNYNEMSYTCVRRLKSLCLRIFLWNYVTTNRYFERVRRERKQNCFIPKKESWTVPNRNDLQQEKLIRLCTYDALRLSHLTTTVSTEILRISCSQYCEAKFCSAMLMDLLKNVRKAEEEPDMEKKLREIVHANSSPYDCTWRLLNA